LSNPYRQSGARGPQRGYFCPGCGRQVERKLRHCPECDTGIATVRCGGCFHMNVPDDALCAGCGQPLGLEPVGEPTYVMCTRCKRPMQAFRGGPGSLYDCDSCGGQFVEHALLRDLLERRERYGESAPRRPPRFNPNGPVAYVKCPTCQATMNRRNFGRSSGVIVDVCALHGTWFDEGELPRVLAFVEAGGLVEARRREAGERRQRAQTRAEEGVGRLSQPMQTGPRYDSGSTTLDAALGLLSFLADLLT
jgi:Zn-finger nucleic acid-binding protein